MAGSDVKRAVSVPTLVLEALYVGREGTGEELEAEAGVHR